MTPRSISPSPSPVPARLAEQLRQTAELLRGEEPLLAPDRLAQHLETLRRSLDRFLKALPAARIAAKEVYQSLRPAWIEAWATDAPHMEKALRKALGSSFPEAPADPRETPGWRLRLLALMLANCGEPQARQLARSVEKRILATTELGFGIPIDREAHEALREWSRLDGEEWLARWRDLDADKIRRAAAVVGMAVPRKWTRALREEIHRRARRFARNTQV